MPDTVADIGKSGFDILNKVADKTSPKFKSYNLVMLTIGILAVFLVVILIDVLSKEDRIDRFVYVTLIILSISLEVIYAVAFIFQDLLNIKRQELNQRAYNQQYQNRD